MKVDLRWPLITLGFLGVAVSVRVAASPLVQVMQQPSFVFSQRQWPQQRLRLQTWMPFHVQQHEQVPSQRA